MQNRCQRTKMKRSNKVFKFRGAFIIFMVSVPLPALADPAAPCASPSSLTGADAVYAGPNGTKIPRFDVRLAAPFPIPGFQPRLNVVGLNNTFQYAALPGQSGPYDTRYIPNSIGELVDPNGLFRSDQAFYGSSGQGVTVDINGVTKWASRTEAWEQPIRLTLTTDAPALLYVNAALGAESLPMLAKAHLGWCDVEIVSEPGSADNREIEIGVLNEYEQGQVDAGRTIHPNPDGLYATLTRLSLSGVDLRFTAPINLRLGNPNDFNHFQSLDMVGGQVVERNTGNSVIFKLAGSSIDFSVLESLNVLPQQNPTSLSFWAAVDPGIPSRHTSEITFGATVSNSILPKHGPINAFVDKDATLVFRDTGAAGALVRMPNYAPSIYGELKSPWTFNLGENATLDFRNAFLDFSYQVPSETGQLDAEGEINLGKNSRLVLSGSQGEVLIDNIVHAATTAGDAAAIDIGRNQHLTANKVQVTNGDLNLSSTPFSGLSFGTLFLENSNLNMSGDLTFDSGVDVRTVVVGGGSSGISIDGYDSGGLSFGQIQQVRDSTLTIDLEAGTSRSPRNVDFTGDFLSFGDGVASTQVNVGQNRAAKFFGTTRQTGVGAPHVVDVALLGDAAVAQFQDEADQVLLTTEDQLRSFDPRSSDPINLGPNGYDVASAAGTTNIVNMFGAVFLNDGFGSGLLGQTDVRAQLGSAVFVGEACFPSAFPNALCQRQRQFGNVAMHTFRRDNVAPLFFDIGVDGSGNAVNDQIAATVIDVVGSEFVIENLAAPGASAPATAEQLAGKLFPLITSIDPTNSRATPDGSNPIVAGASMPAATHLFWVEDPAHTRQFILGAELDLEQLHRRVDGRNRQGKAQVLTLLPSGPSTGPAPLQPVHSQITLSSGGTLASTLSSLTTGQWSQLSLLHVEPYASFMTVSQERTQMIGSAATDHASGGDGGLFGDGAGGHGAGRFIWGDFLMSGGSVGDQGDLSGFDYTMLGVIMGTDLVETETLRSGLFVAFGENEMMTSGANSTEFRSTGATLGAYNHAALADGFRLSSVGSLEYNRNSARRSIPDIGGFSGGVAEGSYDSWGFYAATRLERPHVLEGQTGVLTPFVGLSYASQWFDAVSENGGGDMGYDIAESHADALVNEIGVDFSKRWRDEGKDYSLSVNLSYEHDFLAEARAHHSIDATSQLTGASTEFFGIDRGADGLTVGVGLDVAMTQNAMLSLRGKYGEWSHGRQYELGAKLEVRW